jgi:hypothetical protein
MDLLFAGVARISRAPPRVGPGIVANTITFATLETNRRQLRQPRASSLSRSSPFARFAPVDPSAFGVFRVFRG